MAKKGYRHLTKEKRAQIEILLKNGYSRRRIGRELNLSHTTIAREIKKNHPEGLYQASFAHSLAASRRKLASSKPKKITTATVALIKKMLRETQSSPEQISGRLELEKRCKISPESIYRYIYNDKAVGGTLYLNLRHRAKKYQKRAGKNAGRGLIKNRVGIEHRPLVASSKTRFGDFELDTIVGRNHQGRILSIVDKASKFVFFSLLPNGNALTVADKICQILAPLADIKGVRTLTSDNGKEFTEHQRIKRKIRCDGTFFADPYSSWQRGLNEHTNGLLRQYWPKKTDFTKLTEKDVQDVANRINNRPRKVLNYRTPVEVMSRLLARKLGGALQS